MKDILCHKSWNAEEIVRILLQTGSYTCPMLPHYRYDRVKRVCADLRRRGFIEKCGRTETGVNLRVTERFKEWRAERDAGITGLGPIKWQKEKYPMPAKTAPHIDETAPDDRTAIDP